MTTVIWRPAAHRDLHQHVAVVAERNQDAAKRLLRLLLESEAQLQQFPRFGHLVCKRPEWRELVQHFGKSTYIVGYEVLDDGQTVLILRIWHSSQNRSWE